MKIKNFVQFKKADGFKELNAAIVKALAAVGKKYGVSVATAGVQYSDQYADVKVRLSLVNENGESETPAMMAWRQTSHFYGFQPSDLFRGFIFQGQAHKIMGLRTGAGKYPIVVKREVDGKMFRFDTKTVTLCLKHYAVL